MCACDFQKCTHFSFVINVPYSLHQATYDGTVVAVKTLHKHISNPQECAKFVEEAKFVCQLAVNPNVIRAIGYHEDDKEPFLCLGEYLWGKSQGKDRWD